MSPKLVIAIIFALFVAIGIWVLYYRRFMIQVTAKVLDIDCQNLKIATDAPFTCTWYLEYIVDGKKYQNSLKIKRTGVRQQNLELLVDSNHPMNIRKKDIMSDTSAGYILIVIGIVGLIASAFGKVKYQGMV
jgi:hypothetical protein